MRLTLGYPSQDAERALLRGEDRRLMLKTLVPVISANNLIALQEAVPQVFVSDALIDYVQALVAYTRDSSRFEAGLSPRAGLALLRAAQSHALVSSRKQVLPEDVQAVIPAVVGHRLRTLSGLGSAQNKVLDPAQEMIRAVAIP